ncbi:hypothetical protein [Capnocytophaga leadbetteri]
MPYTNTLTENSVQPLLFGEFVSGSNTGKTKKKREKKATSATQIKQSETIYNAQQKRFKKMLIEGLQEAKEHREGTKKFQSFDDFLSEL